MLRSDRYSSLNLQSLSVSQPAYACTANPAQIKFWQSIVFSLHFWHLQDAVGRIVTHELVWPLFASSGLQVLIGTLRLSSYKHSHISLV